LALFRAIFLMHFPRVPWPFSPVAYLCLGNLYFQLDLRFSLHNAIFRRKSSEPAITTFIGLAGWRFNVYRPLDSFPSQVFRGFFFFFVFIDFSFFYCWLCFERDLSRRLRPPTSPRFLWKISSVHRILFFVSGLGSFNAVLASCSFLSSILKF